jgi:hypothetical protein
LSNTVTLIVGSKLSNTNTVSNKNQISGNKSEAFSVTPNKKNPQKVGTISIYLLASNVFVLEEPNYHNV